VPTVVLPSACRSLAAGRANVRVHGATVAAALDDLMRRHPGLVDVLYDGRGALKRSIGLFVGDDDVRDLDGLATRLGDELELVVVVAMAGG